MNFLIFLAALSASVLAFELMTSFQRAFASFGKSNRLDGVPRTAGDGIQVNTSTITEPTRPSILAALLIAIAPTRFDPHSATNTAAVISQLRRAGYPYSTPGEFYAASMQIFTRYLILGAGIAAALVALDMAIAAAPIAAVFVFLGLRRPYVNLKQAAKKRGEALRNNMLIGLSVLGSLLNSGVGVQEALRRTANVGGPFCNLMGLLVARMGVEGFVAAIQTTRAHLPDLKDVEASLFLRDVEDFFRTNRPLASSVGALRDAVHRSVVEDTESRAALVRQRSGLFGVMAVLGLVFSIIAPFLGSF